MTTNLKLGDVRDSLTEKQKDIFALKLAFVQSETKRLIFETNPGLIGFSFSIGKEVYEKVLNTKEVVEGTISSNLDLIYELCSIATDLANQINSITNGISSGRIESKEFIEEDDFLYSFRLYVQGLAYEKLKEYYGESLDIRQVYFYTDTPIYQKLKDFLESREYKRVRDIAPKYIFEQNCEKVELLGGNVIYLSRDFKKGIDDLVYEFIEYYRENEQFFISRFNLSEGLGDIVGYHFDEAKRKRFFEKE